MRALLLLVLLLPLAAPAEGQEKEVVVARVEGVVGQGTAIYLEDALEEAERRDAPLLIGLDTPGGLVDATLDIQRILAEAQVPVLTYVGPGEAAFAASAGTFLLLMGQPNGMAPGTSIGSAQPIQSSPGGGTQNASAKVENFLVERLRSLAETHGRDADIAELYIRENLNQNATAALETGMVDRVAPDTRAFLDAVDGMAATTARGEVVLDTDGARLVHVGPGLLPRTVDVLSDPTLATILLMAGMYALIFGLANPGTYVAETIGAILLMLGLIGLGLFGIGTAGFLLILLGIVFFVAEAFTPTQGILTAAGVAVLLLAFLFLIDGPLLPEAFLQRLQNVGVALALVSGVVVFAVVRFAVRTRGQAASRLDIGAQGVVTDRLDPEGRVEVWGEVWDAHLEDDEGPLAEGHEVQVVARKGLRLVVRPARVEAAGEDAGHADAPTAQEDVPEREDPPAGHEDPPAKA